MDEELTITTMDFIENKELSAGCIEQGYMTKKCVFSDFQNNFLKKKKKVINVWKVYDALLKTHQYGGLLITRY